MLLFALFGLAAGCAKEEVRGVVDDSVVRTVQTRTEGECTCDVRIDEIQNAKSLDDTWTLDENPLTPGFLYSGMGNQFYDSNNNNALSTPPSGFVPMTDAIPGTHTFQLGYFTDNAPVPEDFTVSITVQCYRENGFGIRIPVYTNSYELELGSGNCILESPTAFVCEFDIETNCDHPSEDNGGINH